MVRRARVVVPDCPHHITQRGNRRERIFFQTGDEKKYLELMNEQFVKHKIECWSYCLMPNHIHFILVPKDETSLGRAVGEAHRRYTQFIGIRDKWRGHLFQGRFFSVAMDEAHLMAAFRYVALNPVKAKLTEWAVDWPHSSTRAIIDGVSDKYVNIAPVKKRINKFAKFLLRENNIDAALWGEIRANEIIGRPVGTKEWLARLEKQFEGRVVPKKRGPKAKQV
ncbi:MAG: transposase [Pseudomonadota bacterium]